MGIKHIWITITAIAALLSKTTGYDRIQIYSEPKIKSQDQEVDQKQNELKIMGDTSLHTNNGDKNSSQVFIGDMLADSLRNFIPFSNVNEKCTRDGQHL